jgi:hypothetical protein
MKSIGALLVALGIVFSTMSEVHALTCYLLTESNELVTFDSATPGGAGAAMPITGIPAGYEMVGIDIRTTVQPGFSNPGVGSLWGLAYDDVANTALLYVINPTTGAATQIGLPLVGIQKGSSGWFFGFNPATDRIRVLNFIYNYEINPNTATFVRQSDLSGFNPNSDGSSFTTASFGGSSQIYFVDQNPNDSLRTSTDISTGVTSVVGDLGIPFTTAAGMDIAGNLMLFAFKDGATTTLYTVNRNTGAATAVGGIGGNPTTRALTIVPATFPPKLQVKVKIKGRKSFSTTRTKVKIKGTASTNSGAIELVEYRVGKGKFKKAKGTKNWRFTARLKGGINKIQVRSVVGSTTSKPAKLKIRQLSPINPV